MKYPAYILLYTPKFIRGILPRTMCCQTPAGGRENGVGAFYGFNDARDVCGDFHGLRRARDHPQFTEFKLPGVVVVRVVCPTGIQSLGLLRLCPTGVLRTSCSGNAWISSFRFSCFRVTPRTAHSGAECKDTCPRLIFTHRRIAVQSIPGCPNPHACYKGHAVGFDTVYGSRCNAG